MPTRHKITIDDLKGRWGADLLTHIAFRLKNDAIIQLISRDYTTLTPSQRKILSSLTPQQKDIVENTVIYVDTFSAEDDGIDLCPKCNRVLVQSGNVWVCSGADYYSELLTYRPSAPYAPLSERIIPLAEWAKDWWLRECGGTQVYQPPKRHRKELLDLIPEQLAIPLTLDELVARMRYLFREGGHSEANSTVRPKYVRAKLDSLRAQGKVRVLVSGDGAARFARCSV